MKKILAVFLVLSLIGCSGDKNSENTDTSDKSISVSNENMEKSDSITLSMRAPKSLNPLVNEDVTVDYVLKLVFKSLFTYNENMEVVPELVDYYNLSPEGTSLDITLKEDIFWHDGNSIKAEDVVFSLDTIKNGAATGLYKNALANVTDYKAVNDKTVTITFNAPYGAYIYNFVFPVIPKHYYKDKEGVDLKPLGSGDFSFYEYENVKKLQLKKVGTEEIINVLITSDRQTDVYAFEQNVINVLSVNIDEWGYLNSNEGFNVTNYNTTDFEFFGFNHLKDSFKNKNFRIAVAHSIPREDIIENIYLSQGVKSLVPVNPESFLAYEGEMYDYEYDISKAKHYFGASGVTDTDFTILVNSENEGRIQIAQMICVNLNQIGLNTRVVIKPFSEYQKMLAEDNFDMFVGGITLSRVPDLRPLLSSTSPSNFCNYSDSYMDSLLTQATNSIGTESFKRSVGNIQLRTVDELPFVGICFKKSAVLTKDYITGRALPTINNVYNGVNIWSVK